MMASFSLNLCTLFRSNAPLLAAQRKTYSAPLCCYADKKHSLEMSSVFTRNLAATSQDLSWGVVDAGSLVLGVRNQNGPVLDMQDEGIGIVKFLKNKVILITGATGFLGKVLIEKILRTAPDVQKIFVLIKASSKEAAAERLNTEVKNIKLFFATGFPSHISLPLQIIGCELFKRLKQIHGKSFQSFTSSKLVPIVGNLCEPSLSLDEDDAHFVAKHVDIIMNSAANTSFDERYDTALDINTCGPTRILDFAKKCHKLLLFVQVSTAYVNGQRQGRIMEKPFTIGESIEIGSQHEPLCVEDEIKLVLQSKQALEEHSVPQKMKELGKLRANKFGWQDTYTFTKAMGEMMIDSLRGNVPVVIIRPSVIESTYWEPFPGWIEGNRMMDPIILSYGKRHLTGFLVDPEGVQVASSAVNPLVYRDLAETIYKHFKHSPFLDSKGNPAHVTPIQLFRSMEDFGTHLWRNALDRAGLGTSANLDSKLSEKLQIICRKSVEQAKYLANLYEPYTFYGGRFDNSNTKRLMECMCKEEIQQFGFDVESIDWKDYISKVHIPGLRRHVMKGSQEYL